MIFNVTSKSLLGKFENRVIKLGCRRLNTKNKGSVTRYNQVFEEQLKVHKLREKLIQLDLEIGDDNSPSTEQISQMEAIHLQTTETMLNAERRCQRILKPDLEFSNEVKFWHERVNAWRALLNLHKGKVKHKGHCFLNAEAAGITDSQGLNQTEIEEGLSHAKARRKLLKLEAPALRRMQLKTDHLKAVCEGKDSKATDILNKIKSEEAKKMWFHISQSMKGQRSGSIMKVQKIGPDGVVMESGSKEETENMIFEETEFRFKLAADAPISATELIHKLGHLADTEIAAQIVESNYDIKEDIDDETRAIIEEIGALGVELTNGKVSIIITPEEFSAYWKKSREGISSSISGIHFGHYKAAATSHVLSSFLS